MASPASCIKSDWQFKLKNVSENLCFQNFSQASMGEKKSIYLNLEEEKEKKSAGSQHAQSKEDGLLEQNWLKE